MAQWIDIDTLHTFFSFFHFGLTTISIIWWWWWRRWWWWCWTVLMVVLLLILLLLLHRIHKTTNNPRNKQANFDCLSNSQRCSFDRCVRAYHNPRAMWNSPPHLSLFPNISFGLMIDENLDCAVVHRHLTSRSEWDNRLEHNRHNWVLSAELCAISLEMCLFILVLFCFLSFLLSPFVYLSTLWHWLILKGVTEMVRPMLDQSSTQKKSFYIRQNI